MDSLKILLLIALIGACGAVPQKCPEYTTYSKAKNPPLSNGRYQLPYQRPEPACRTFVAPEIDETIAQMESSIADPDLYRLFQNSFPNTLDTTVRWKGNASGSDEELSFVITGDIEKMWLRDSANQMQSYKALLVANSSCESLASVYRGVINLQSRYIRTSPYCNAFQPPVESGIQTGGGWNDLVHPPYQRSFVFECKYELDSLAAFLEVSYDYWHATDDTAFFGKYKWTEAVRSVLGVATAMRLSTYSPDGSVNISPYTFQRNTANAAESLTNNGNGNPVQNGTGLIRSAFRPSDDSTIYELFIPANMMFASYLRSTSAIARGIGDLSLADNMSSMADGITAAIKSHGIVNAPGSGEAIYAYEVDGYGGQNLMDDANLPSLMSAPLYGFLDKSDPIYQSTRQRLLGPHNPYFAQGPILSAIGGPHNGPGQGWPMASIVRIRTSDDDNEIMSELEQLVSSTDGLGLIHESINAFNQTDWTRSWFAWANGLFGQMILDLQKRKPHILQQSFQQRRAWVSDGQSHVGLHEFPSSKRNFFFDIPPSMLMALSAMASAVTVLSLRKILRRYWRNSRLRLRRPFGNPLRDL